MPTVRLGLVALAIGLGLSVPAAAAEDWEGHLAGAWTLPDNTCSEIFDQHDGNWVFHQPVDMFGPSFIISGREIRGPEATCRILRASQHKDKLSLVISCSNSVSFMQNVVNLRVKNDHEVVRLFPGSEDLSVTYKKCPH